MTRIQKFRITAIVSSVLFFIGVVITPIIRSGNQQMPTTIDEAAILEQLQFADGYYKREIYDRAADAYHRVSATQSSYADGALFFEAICLDKIGNNGEAAIVRQNYLDRFPAGPHADECNRLLAAYRNAVLPER